MGYGKMEEVGIRVFLPFAGFSLFLQIFADSASSSKFCLLVIGAEIVHSEECHERGFHTSSTSVHAYVVICDRLMFLHFLRSVITLRAAESISCFDFAKHYIDSA